MRVRKRQRTHERERVRETQSENDRVRDRDSVRERQGGERCNQQRKTTTDQVDCELKNMQNGGKKSANDLHTLRQMGVRCIELIRKESISYVA